MLTYRHIMRFFHCSRSTAFRWLRYYRDIYQHKRVTIAEFCENENITVKQFKDSLL